MKQKKKVARLKKRQADYASMISKPSTDDWKGFKKPGSFSG